MIPDHKVRVLDFVGESQLADPDTFEDAVASQLMHDKRRVRVARLFQLVGDDATDEVRMSRVQIRHQLHQRLAMTRGNGHQSGT